MSIVGKHFTYLDRELVVISSYEGHGPDDPNGYFYRFIDEPNRRYVTTGASAVRFKPVPPWPANDREWARVNQPLTID